MGRIKYWRGFGCSLFRKMCYVLTAIEFRSYTGECMLLDCIWNVFSRIKYNLLVFFLSLTLISFPENDEERI